MRKREFIVLTSKNVATKKKFLHAKEKIFFLYMNFHISCLNSQKQKKKKIKKKTRSEGKFRSFIFICVCVEVEMPFEGLETASQAIEVRKDSATCM